MKRKPHSYGYYKQARQHRKEIEVNRTWRSARTWYIKKIPGR